MRAFLDFEKTVADLEGKIEELRHLSDESDVNIAEEVARLNVKVERQLRTTYQKLTPWQKVQVARHPDRPHFKDVVEHLVEDFTPLAGDRHFAEDRAVVGGPGRFRGRSVMVIGTEKGESTQQRLDSNFGMARPEGYRKAGRLMRMADRFGMPVLTFVDTAGAYPGIGAEERGQAEAIARSIQTSLSLRVPIISAIIGEGGSGGAVALATADRVIMFEHAIYSVISPEGCASILWRSGDHAREAAEALRLTAQDLLRLSIVERVVPEPLGAAHREKTVALTSLADAVEEELAGMLVCDPAELRRLRRERFLAIGGELG
ncbi:MAG: acetyl-CoA carboxylase carboxyltransferase subunit alpha [Alphaproteobacteria bacterium]|nr:acetyl-CoA carboxylase carboxyltransferase subunit alpha [Alphaproteobacteria bacterium]